MNYLYTFTRKHRAYCVFVGPIIKVCLERLSYLKSVSHLINIPCFLGLYGKNIGPPGLGSKKRGLPHRQLIRFVIVKLFNTSGNSTSLPQKTQIKAYHPIDNRSELQRQGTSEQLLFLFVLVLLTGI